MIKDEGYLVNLDGIDRWYGSYTFDDPEEAITKAIMVIKENDYAEAEDLFGDFVYEEYQDDPNRNLSDITSFEIGIVDKLKTPKDAMSDIAEYLDNHYWDEYSIDGESPSDYVLSDENVKELNELVYNYLKPLVEESSYYVVHPLAEISVEDISFIKRYGNLGEKT